MMQVGSMMEIPFAVNHWLLVFELQMYLHGFGSHYNPCISGC